MNKKIERVILHVGPYKTGTSSIQHSLFRNKARLAEDDLSILYPSSEHRQHGVLLCLMFGNPEEVKIKAAKSNLYGNDLKRYIRKNKKQLEREINRTKLRNLIISGEVMSLFSAKQLEDIRNYFISLAPNAKFTVVVNTREMSALTASAVQQYIKDKLMTISLKTVMDRNTMLYKTILTNIEKVFPNEEIIIYKFEDAVKHLEGPIGMLIEKIIGLTPPLGLKNVQKNTSCSDKAVDILKFINKYLPFMSGSKLNKGRFKMDTIYLRKLSGNKFSLSKDELNKAAEHARGDISWLKENYGIDYTDTPLSMPGEEMIFDNTYVNEYKKYFRRSSLPLQKLSYDYIIYKLKDLDENDSNFCTLSSLKQWMLVQEKNYKTESLTYFIEKFDNMYELKKLQYFVRFIGLGKKTLKNRYKRMKSIIIMYIAHKKRTRYIRKKYVVSRVYPSIMRMNLII